MNIKCSYTELVDTHKLTKHPKNPNKHSKEQIERLSKIIDYQGQRSPVVVSKLSGFVVVGHGRLEAMKKLGWEKIAVDYQDFENEAQEYAHLTADNAIAEWAQLDLSQINIDILDLGPDLDLDMLGLKDFVVEPIEKFEPQCDEDAVPEVVHPITRRGDVWLLGNHRLMCGDSTMSDDFEKLMNGEKADITFTSPPYNAGKTPKESGKYNNYEDDLASSEYVEFLNSFTTNCLMFSDYVFCNIQSISGNKVALIDYLYMLKDKYADTMIWNKGHGQPAMARRVLNSAFEYVHIFSNEAKRSIGKRDFRGTISNIFEMSSRSDKEFSSIHKATFPISFADKFVTEFSESSVIEPFSGTGTTMISCEKNKRKCFCMELSEQYSDISILRWEKYTGKKAVLESTGQTYEELKLERLNG